MTHWATTYIGRPWVYGARGPDEFDCWGLVRYIQKLHFGIEMPDVEVPSTWSSVHALMETHEERQNWIQVIDCKESDVVLMARNKLPVHIGVAIQANGSLGVLHCLENSGVVYQTPAALRSSGWGRLTYFRREL